MKLLLLATSLAVFIWAQESTGEIKPTAEQLQAQLKSANAQIAQLEERIKLMIMQQQGAVQFFQAGQALCELDKKQPQPIKTERQ